MILQNEKKASTKSLKECNRFPPLALISSRQRQNSLERNAELKEVFKPNLLIANDEPIFLQVVQTSMGDKFNIDLAVNGLEALDLVKMKGSTYYHAIILDINMPIMDGIEACNKIHAFISDEEFIKHMQLK
jgi:response regulator RpfG family c-di-GMP phosphodiesterase